MTKDVLRGCGSFPKEERPSQAKTNVACIGYGEAGNATEMERRE